MILKHLHYLWLVFFQFTPGSIVNRKTICLAHLKPGGQLRSTIMSNGHLVFWVETIDALSPKFHICNEEGNQVDTLPPLCQHVRNIDVQSVMIQDKEYVAVSCANCSAIRLRNIAAGEVSVAFKNNSYWPGHMCKGNQETLFVVNLTKENSIIEIDCGTTNFDVKTVMKTNMEVVYDICYVPSKDILLACNWNPGLIRAVSRVTHDILWEVTNATIAQFRPHSMIYIPQKYFVLVADGPNNRILALQPTCGEIAELLKENDSGSFLDFYLLNDFVVAQKVVRDEIGEALILSYYTVSNLVSKTTLIFHFTNHEYSMY